MNPLTLIRFTIFNKLNTLLTNKAKVYAYFESNPAQYPALMFDIASQQNEFISNVENMSSITFKMILMIQQADENSASGLNEEDATNKLDTLTDSIIRNLEADFSLGGVVDYCIPTVGNRESTAIPNGIAKIQYINLVTKQTRVA